jgi:hypothetical protein
MLYLLDQASQRLRVTDRTVVNPLLIAGTALPDRLEVGIGLALGNVQIGDPGLGSDQIGCRSGSLGLELCQLRVLGKVGPAVPQLGDRGIDALQIQQPKLGRVVGFDESALPCVLVRIYRLRLRRPTPRAFRGADSTGH